MNKNIPPPPPHHIPKYPDPPRHKRLYNNRLAKRTNPRPNHCSNTNPDIERYVQQRRVFYSYSQIACCTTVPRPACQHVTPHREKPGQEQRLVIPTIARHYLRCQLHIAAATIPLPHARAILHGLRVRYMYALGLPITMHDEFGDRRSASLQLNLHSTAALPTKQYVHCMPR